VGRAREPAEEPGEPVDLFVAEVLEEQALDARHVRDARLAEPSRIAKSALAHAESWLQQSKKASQEVLEAGSRRFAMTIGRAFELALLIEHAQWSQIHQSDGCALAAARRFASSGIDMLIAPDVEDTYVLFDRSDVRPHGSKG